MTLTDFPNSRPEFESKKMAVNISGLRRNIKNVAHNYTDAQVNLENSYHFCLSTNFLLVSL